MCESQLFSVMKIYPASPVDRFDSLSQSSFEIIIEVDVVL